MDHDISSDSVTAGSLIIEVDDVCASNYVN